LESRRSKSAQTNGEEKMSWKPVAGIPTLQAQVNKRWPNRDKASDGVKGDSAHASRISDHNPDGRGLVHAVDIDEDFRGSKYDNRWFADQLIAYPRMKVSGSARLKNVVYENQVASGTYPKHFWTWRNGDYGHEKHIHISFSKSGEQDGNEFNIPILYGQGGVWDGYVPFFDVLEDAVKTGVANKATWRLACRLKELGFYQGTVQPEGKQAYPKNAIRAMQDYMGWQRRDYDEKLHRAIWKELTLSNPEP
jgi:hypothetical protein